MASGNSRVYTCSFVGVAAEVVLELPFTPRVGQFAVATGGAIEHGVKTDEMSGSGYLSTTTGLDAGVTFGDRSVTIDSGADINVATETVYCMFWD